MTTTSVTPLLDRLSAEHQELLPRVAELVELAEAGGDGLESAIDGVAELLRAPLEAHIAQEDDILFPAYADKTGDRTLVRIFYDEHREILALRDELLALRHKAPAGVSLSDAVLRLGDLLTSHMTREETMLFPSARALMLDVPVEV